MWILENAIFLCIAYLIGSVCTAIIVCRLMKLPDPRTQGSHNPGATNVLRIGGKKAAALTLLGDALKGFLPVAGASWYGLDATMIGLIGFAAVLGHVFPIFFHFKGGKGVATALGVMIAFSWKMSLVWVITWLIILVLFRYASLSAIICSLLAPLYLWMFTDSLPLTYSIIAISALVIIRHHTNIRNLLTGKEDTI